MIIAIVGGIGKGKSVTAVRSIMTSKKIAFTNFKVKCNNVIRLKKDDIVITEKDEKGKKICRINWDFWESAMEKYKDFDIYIDEISAIPFLNARRAMSKESVAGMAWVAQIRKILGQSERSHLYLICQNVNQIDIAWRRLLHGIILCGKKEVNFTGKKTSDIKIVITLTSYFTTDRIDCEQRFELDMPNRRKKAFVANPYFCKYNSYKLVRSDDEYL